MFKLHEYGTSIVVASLEATPRSTSMKYACRRNESACHDSKGTRGRLSKHSAAPAPGGESGEDDLQSPESAQSQTHSQAMTYLNHADPWDVYLENAPCSCLIWVRSRKCSLSTHLLHSPLRKKVYLQLHEVKNEVATPRHCQCASQ